MHKIQTIEEAIKQLDSHNQQLDSALDSERFDLAIEILKNRLIVISAITEFKVKQSLSDSQKAGLDRVLADGDVIQEKIMFKRNRIGQRLENSRKVNAVNKNIAY